MHSGDVVETVTIETEIWFKLSRLRLQKFLRPRLEIRDRDLEFVVLPN